MLPLNKQKSNSKAFSSQKKTQQSKKKQKEALKSIDNKKSQKEKSKKSGILMIPSLSKKIVGFVKKGVNLKSQQKQLLPKVPVVKQLYYDIYESQHQNKSFIQCQKNITEKLKSFKESIFSNPDYMQSEQLVTIQTQKIYSHIPKIYFQEKFSQQKLNNMLSKHKVQVQQRVFQLQDYHDEVQLSLNQQVQHKLRTFIQFLECQNNIKGLVDISLQRVKITRAKNSIINQQIYKRVKRINQLRVKQKNITQWKNLLDQFKKFKDVEAKLLNSIQLLNRGKLITFYQDYQKLHEKFKSMCCGININNNNSGKSSKSHAHFYQCKFHEIAHYVNFNYQDYFLKSLKNYLSQVIICPKQPLKKIFISKHSQFISVQPVVLSGIDQSIQFQEIVVLTVKQNIQRQINDTFRQGMYMCSYQTDKLQESIESLFKQFLKDFYTTLNQSINHKPVMLFDHLQQELSQEQKTKKLNKTKKEVLNALSKISLDKYIQILEIFSQSIECMLKRCTSIIGKLLKTAVQLQTDDMPQRYEIIVAFLTPILKFFIQYANDTIGQFFQARQVKDNQLQLARKIIEICKEWEYLSTKISKIYPQLAEFPRILGYRKALVRRSYDSMHQKVTNFDIKKVLQQDNFQPTMVNTRLYSIIGYILDGYAFKKAQKNKQRNMLSSSLLIQKRQSQLHDSSLLQDSRLSNSQDKYQIHSFSIQQDRIIISNRSYKIIQSTQFLLQYICNYLENYDQYPHLREQVQEKLIELIVIYHAKIDQLILKGRALELPNKKIKASSINARILSLSYVQVNLLLNICEEWTKRIKMDQQKAQFLKIKLNALLNNINLKFNRIVQEMQYLQISIITSNCNQQQITIIMSDLAQNVRSSFKFVQSNIIQKDIFNKFCGGIDWQKQLQCKLLQKCGDAESAISFFLSSIHEYAKYLPYLYQKYGYLIQE